jgi:uncharacterized membrane protein
VNFGRLCRHVFATRARLARAFPAQALDAIERAIADSERTHGGEVRFAIEHGLEPYDVWKGKSSRDRALEVFATLGCWDTEANNGVLIYLLLADRDVHIVADRGLNGRVLPNQWQFVCEAMEQRLRAGQYEQGAVEGVRTAGQLLALHFPPRPDGRDENELPNRPAVL